MRSTLTAIAALTLSAAPLAAQQASALRVGITSPMQSSGGLHRERADTFPAHPRSTYWKEGAIILGLPAAVGLFLFDREPDKSAIKSVAVGLRAGLMMGAIGGLTGWFFAKPEKPEADPEEILMWRSLMTITALTVSAGQLPAQQVSSLRVGISAPTTTSAEPMHRHLVTERRSNGTYWKEGALILGIPTAIGSYLFFGGMADDKSLGLATGLFHGAIAGATGAFIGWFFPKGDRKEEPDVSN